MTNLHKYDKEVRGGRKKKREGKKKEIKEWRGKETHKGKNFREIMKRKQIEKNRRKKRTHAMQTRVMNNEM